MPRHAPVAVKGDEMTNTDSTLSATRNRRFLRRIEAAAYVSESYGFPCSCQWLAKLAVIGGGPIFRKAGRYPIYELGDLDQWARARIGPARRSTSDVTESGGGKSGSDAGRG
jgi:hypothetical protein